MEIDIIMPTESWKFRDWIKRKLEIWLMSLTAKSDLDTSREERFATVVRDYGSMISGICFSFSSDSQDAADLRQDILLNIWKGLATYRLDSSLSTWLYRVALNTCVSTVRKRKTHVATIALDAVGEYGAEAEVEDQERVEWLYDRIASLPSLDKAIVTMWLDERPYEEIAQVVGISRNNVAVRLNRIKQRMAVGIR